MPTPKQRQVNWSIVTQHQTISPLPLTRKDFPDGIKLITENKLKKRRQFRQLLCGRVSLVPEPVKYSLNQGTKSSYCQIELGILIECSFR